MSPSLSRRLAALCAAAALALPARAPAEIFPVPVHPHVVLTPLVLLLVPLGMKFSRRDEDRVRLLERRGDWQGLADLATRRLAARPGDVQWHELRGRALQRLGRCPEAVPDLRLAFQSSLAGRDAAFASGLALGLCELALGDLAAAGATFERPASLAPARWEPDYNLAIIRTRQGDAAAANAALASLRAKDAQAAEGLLAYLAATAGPPAAGSAPVRAEALLPAPAQLQVGSRRLALPGGPWMAGPAGGGTARGGTLRVPTGRDTAVPFAMASAYTVQPDGQLAAAVRMAANPQEAHGIAYWNAEDGCAEPQAHVDRFRSGFDQPECLAVRRVDAAAAQARWGGWLAEAGLAFGGLHYELHYERHGPGRLVRATVLLPAAALPGDMAAIQWGQAMAAQLRPLAGPAASAAATLPPWAAALRP